MKVGLNARLSFPHPIELRLSCDAPVRFSLPEWEYRMDSSQGCYLYR